MPSKPIHAIHHPIAIDRGLGELVRETDYASHVEQLIKQVLFTAPGERINRPDFGCGIRQMVFAPLTEATSGLVKVTVLAALDRWLAGVIKTQEVKVEAIAETLEIRIAYVLLSNQEQRWLNLEVTL
ncbi:MAG TPA: GPW/gp25 family protein [Kofleriaceae bacterium]|nr:GPW/gp25 family protein [Kofleriaceae bacterium]